METDRIQLKHNGKYWIASVASRSVGSITHYARKKRDARSGLIGVMLSVSRHWWGPEAMISAVSEGRVFTGAHGR